jgi:ribA/ribD-fused uncharacterized protein
MTTYPRAECVVFRKTKETWGGLSNMAAGFPLSIAGVRILTSEALYQACRFPNRPDVQRAIIEEKSPMSAKMVGKPFRAETRSDWHQVRVDVMRWCLRVKLKQNWASFEGLLRGTGNRDIVEDSHKDTFWGAKASKENSDVLIGENVLGRLLVELRQEVVSGMRTATTAVDPLHIPDWLLLGNPVVTI